MGKGAFRPWSFRWRFIGSRRKRAWSFSFSWSFARRRLHDERVATDGVERFSTPSVVGGEKVSQLVMTSRKRPRSPTSDGATPSDAKRAREAWVPAVLVTHFRRNEGIDYDIATTVAASEQEALDWIALRIRQCGPTRAWGTTQETSWTKEWPWEGVPAVDAFFFRGTRRVDVDVDALCRQFLEEQHKANSVCDCPCVYTPGALQDRAMGYPCKTEARQCMGPSWKILDQIPESRRRFLFASSYESRYIVEGWSVVRGPGNCFVATHPTHGRVWANDRVVYCNPTGVWELFVGA